MEGYLPGADAVSKKRGNRGLIAVVSVLVAIIIGLVVAIVVVKVREGETMMAQYDEYGESLTPSVVAATICDEIKDSYLSNDSTYEETIKKYSQKVEEYDGELKANIILFYSDFLSSYGNDDEEGDDPISLLEDNSEFFTGDELLARYYLMLKTVYGKAGDAEKASEYREKYELFRPDIRVRVDKDGNILGEENE